MHHPGSQRYQSYLPAMRQLISNFQMNLNKLFRNLVVKINPLSEHPEYKNEFYRDICYTNYARLRIWSYFLILFAISQLYFDLTVKGIYTLYQIEIFLRADIVLAFLAIIFFMLTHFYKANLPKNITALHQSIIISYLFFHLHWGAVISATESVSANGLPTFLICIFSAATIFYVRGSYFTVFLISSLVTLYVMLKSLLPDQTRIIPEYYSVVTLVVIAWILSRILFINRLNNFIAARQLVQSNLNLDKTVKERTSELTSTNELLMKEISERKKYEHELLVAVKIAEEADKLKSVFLANISHEIRTPLNGILGFCELLDRSAVPAERCAKYIDIIKNSGQQLLRIIDDILDISLIESHQLKINKISFPLNKKINEIYEFYNFSKTVTGKENILLSCVKSLPDGQDTIFTDPYRLQQIINNLLRNAFKFTYDGKVEFGYEAVNNEYLFFVSDTGIGVDKDKQKIIFEQFRQGDETLKRNFGGTGLGLAISKGIVEQLGGRIWLDTPCPEGSRFCFTIPLKSSDTFGPSEN